MADGGTTRITVDTLTGEGERAREGKEGKEAKREID